MDFPKTSSLTGACLAGNWVVSVGSPGYLALLQDLLQEGIRAAPAQSWVARSQPPVGMSAMFCSWLAETLVCYRVC